MRWGVIGAGEIAEKFLKQVVPSGAAPFHGVASRDAARASAMTAKHGLVRAYGDYDQIMSDPDIAILYIAVTNNAHFDTVYAALENGKHVLCEKPLTLNSSDAARLIGLAREQNLFLMEGYMYRAHPVFRHVKSMVRAGKVGRVLHVHSSHLNPKVFARTDRRFRRDLGGGAIMDLGGYAMSAAHALVGGEAAAKLTGGGTIAETGVDIWAVASAHFAGHGSASLVTGFGRDDASELDVYGEEGSIHLRDPWKVGPDDAKVVRVVSWTGSVEETRFEGTSAFVAEVQEVSSNVDSLESDCMTWTDTLLTARGLEAWRSVVGVTWST